MTIYIAPADALQRLAQAERRLAEALAIIDNTARETMLDQAPCYAIALLTEDEQKRVYALLLGDVGLAPTECAG